MLIGLMADIHANREAFEACLADARARGVSRFVFLGDYVGYGADPEWVVETLMELVSAGSRALLGNHDAAVGARTEVMESAAAEVIEWTRGRLGAPERAFLSGLPAVVEDEGRLFVHSEAVAPAKWTYVNEPPDAARSMRATRLRTTFCGHVHKPSIYSMSEMWGNVAQMWKVTPFRPATSVAVPLLAQRRWLVVLGSVGQPRDGNPAAAWSLLDTQANVVTFHRVPYDIDTTEAKIRKAGLPGSFAERLRIGR